MMPITADLDIIRTLVLYSPYQLASTADLRSSLKDTL